MGGVKLKQTTATAASARVSLATVCRWDAFRAREAPKRVLGIVRSRVSVCARLRTGREARDCVCAADGAVAASDVRNGKRAGRAKASKKRDASAFFECAFSQRFPENLTFRHEAREKNEIPIKSAFAPSQPRTGQSNRASCVLVSIGFARINFRCSPAPMAFRCGAEPGARAFLDRARARHFCAFQISPRPLEGERGRGGFFHRSRHASLGPRKRLVCGWRRARASTHEDARDARTCATRHLSPTLIVSTSRRHVRRRNVRARVFSSSPRPREDHGEALVFDEARGRARAARVPGGRRGGLHRRAVAQRAGRDVLPLRLRGGAALRVRAAHCVAPRRAPRTVVASDTRRFF